MPNEIKKYMQDAKFPSEAHNDEIDLRELFSVIWQGKWLIIAITTVFAIGSVVFAVMQPNIYKSEALLAPAAEEQGGGLSALASQFGGLASLAGVNLGGKGGTDKTQLAIEVLKSRQFTSEFIQSIIF
ncbi:Chain length determinant protein [Shewanella morhuae]|nr:Chain length determinant protein [Shewanella morhuae]